MKTIALVFALLVCSCDSFGPSVVDVNACAASCSGSGGMKAVTYSKCECAGLAPRPEPKP